MSIHSICVCGEIRKLFTFILLLSGAMQITTFSLIIREMRNILVINQTRTVRKVYTVRKEYFGH